MKHVLKLQKNNHPLWHLFTCTKCGEDVRISKWEMRQLLKGNWSYGYDFLTPCSRRI